MTLASYGRWWEWRGRAQGCTPPSVAFSMGWTVWNYVNVLRIEKNTSMKMRKSP